MTKLKDVNKNQPSKAALKLMDMLFSDHEMATHLYKMKKKSSGVKPYLSDTHREKVERLEGRIVFVEYSKISNNGQTKLPAPNVSVILRFYCSYWNISTLNTLLS